MSNNNPYTDYTKTTISPLPNETPTKTTLDPLTSRTRSSFSALPDDPSPSKTTILDSPTNTPQPPPPQPAKDPITCHVLDTTAGTPARNLTVSLTLLRPLGPSGPFTAATDTDGRISTWNQPDGPTMGEIFENLNSHAEEAQMVWELRFDTGGYYGEGKTFFPEVRVAFFVNSGDGRGKGHCHVPLLLGPWGYTTYRGS